MDVHAFMPGTYVVGKLVEIERRSGGDGAEYQTAFVLIGRQVVELDVAKDLRDSLEQHADADVVVKCIYAVRWIDTANGRRPTGKLRAVEVFSERSRSLAAAA